MILLPHIDFGIYIFFVIGLCTVTTWIGRFIRWCWIHWRVDSKKKKDITIEKELEVYKEYYDARIAYFNQWGMQKIYNSPEWRKIEEAEDAILSFGKKENI